MDVAADQLNIQEMVCGVGNQLRYVERFSTSRKGHRENIAEHQYFTAFFTMMIGLHLGWTNDQLGTAVTRALIHDVEEHATGDILRPVKHKTNETKALLEKHGAECCRSFFELLTTNRELANQLFYRWQFAKENSQQGLTVKFADYLSVLSYVYQEVKGGNAHMRRIVTEIDDYGMMFNRAEFKFLGNLVQQAEEIMKELRRL